ncbi:MAG: transketolase [Armatimonadota bacterium]|nr:transketolase [Armatimonadota bacterium]
MPILDSTTLEPRRTYSVEELEDAAQEMRAWVMIGLQAAGSGHTGGTMSIAEVAAALYLHHIRHDPADPKWEGRDRVFWSAGHKAPMIYVALGMAGYFDDMPVAYHGEPLEQFADVPGIQKTVLLRKLGSPFEGHPNSRKLPGIEVCSGSLGQGLGIANGSALNAKIYNQDYRVYCIMGDGEQQEGSIWEAVMFAAHHALDNLVGIIDDNGLQIDGPTAEVCNVQSLEEKYRAFGWEVFHVDGHDMEDILGGLERADSVKGRPALIIADTIKGKCVDFAEDVVGYHGVPPKDGRTGEESLDRALESIGVTDKFPPERVDEILAFADAYGEIAQQRADEEVPKFGRDWWWNETGDMQVEMDATRNGFGDGIAEVGADPNVVAHGADITGSIRMSRFYEPDGEHEDPERKKRFVSCGIAEANMAEVAAGFAIEGRTPFIGSYGVFATGRNWDQLRTTVGYSGLPVKIADAHGGVSVGPDGATHQALEEIFLVTAIPGYVMYVPCDAVETAKATKAAATNGAPTAVRFAREATPIVTTEETPFEPGVANIIRYRGSAPNFVDAFETVLSTDYTSEGEDLALIACGPMVPESMRAAVILKEEYDLETRVVNLHTVKPIDRDAIAAARDTGVVVTAEEHQVGGMGNRVAAVMCEAGLDGAVRFGMIGVQDRFGESGEPWQLVKVFGVTGEHIARKALDLMDM